MVSTPTSRGHDRRGRGAGPARRRAAPGGLHRRRVARSCSASRGATRSRPARSSSCSALVAAGGRRCSSARWRRNARPGGVAGRVPGPGARRARRLHDPVPDHARRDAVARAADPPLLGAHRAAVADRAMAAGSRRSRRTSPCWPGSRSCCWGSPAGASGGRSSASRSGLCGRARRDPARAARRRDLRATHVLASAGHGSSVPRPRWRRFGPDDGQIVAEACAPRPILHPATGKPACCAGRREPAWGARRPGRSAAASAWRSAGSQGAVG